MNRKKCWKDILIPEPTSKKQEVAGLYWKHRTFLLKQQLDRTGLELLINLKHRSTTSGVSDDGLHGRLRKSKTAFAKSRTDWTYIKNPTRCQSVLVVHFGNNEYNTRSSVAYWWKHWIYRVVYYIINDIFIFPALNCTKFRMLNRNMFSLK